MSILLFVLAVVAYTQVHGVLDIPLVIQTTPHFCDLKRLDASNLLPPDGSPLG
jgi:hypothetical protein